ncbi:MAG: EAL domain-containing protein [Cyanobacteria bacterium J06598_3]
MGTSFGFSPHPSVRCSLLRVSCLLQCPADTPQLWPQLLSVLGDLLDCSGGQLLLSAPLTANAASLHVWNSELPKGGEFLDAFDADDWHLSGDSAVRAGGAISVAAALELLWQHFKIPIQSEPRALWRYQATDLQAQLANIVAGGDFQLGGLQTYEAGGWPVFLSELWGGSDDCHVALLPLCHPADPLAQTSGSVPDVAFDGAGVLVLFRSPSQGAWTPDVTETIEAAGSQIYLALRRSHLEQVARSRSACDQLTQLPDRVLFNQQLAQSITTTIKQDTMLGVAFLDLDRFKNINDTLGHEAGDCLLKQVAERLKSCLRGYDVVARWGGDEFTLLLSCLRSPEDISQIADRILHRLAAPFYVQEEELYVTASLGIALAPYDGEDGQTLLRNADAAMYQAKAKGRNNYQIYFEEINANARTQLNLETDLRKALDQDELLLYYQPQVDLLTGQWIGLEALIRWQHPTLGMISPNKFIPIAEETGLIDVIGHWVLEAACIQYGQWQQVGFPQIRLAVNLSPHQFHRSHMVRTIMQILKSTGFDPRYLELEVTESAAMRDVKFAIEVLKKLSQSGIQIAMDDFGTGYSSLSVLKHFPLHTIKIDRSFVMDLVDSPSDAAIASTIIALAKGLNFKVLAEGIETPEQVAVLSDMGCDYAQGYWFSRPLSVGQIDKLLAEGTFGKA